MTTPLSGKPTFGAGRVFAIGNYANPTPARALTPQSQSIDFKRKTESLFGENQLAVAVGAGEMEVTGKVEYAKTQARILADIMFGDAGTTGSYLEADGEAGTVAASSPYIITVVNSANWVADLGVVDVATGNIMTCVASGPVAGKSYTVAAGIYTFAAGDEGTNKKISYYWTQAAVGETVALNNQPQGLTGNFQAIHVLPWGTEQDMFVFFNCIAGSHGLSMKKSGFGMSTLDYTAAVNGSGELGVATFAEAA
jgi:hypothetical protein